MMRIHTFVILGYKESPYIEECILSLKAQRVPSDIILTTSTPNDHLSSLAQKYNIPYFINQNPAGTIGSDWNFALSKAQTPLVTLAHQDDIYQNEFSQQVIHTYNHYMARKLQLVFTGYADLVGDNLRDTSRNAIVKKVLLLPFRLSRAVKNKFLKTAALAFGDAICCPSVTLNMAYLKDFKFDEHYTCALDWEAWYRLAHQEGYFVYLSEVLLLHRIHPGSETTVQLENGKRSREEAAIFKKIWGRAVGSLLSSIYKLGHLDNRL